MWNLINLNNFEIVKDFWNGRGDLGMDLDAWAKNTRAAAGRYMLVGNHENNKGFVIIVDVSDVKLEREVKVGNRKISPDDMFSSCLVVNGADRMRAECSNEKCPKLHVVKPTEASPKNLEWAKRRKEVAASIDAELMRRFKRAACGGE